jgi:Holliday junction resolvasome RuvABC endonuclease subunit
MTILSIDQSYTHCAYCIIDGRDVIHFGVIKSNKENSIYKRALDISLELGVVFTTYKPTEIRLEGLAFGMRGDATRDLAGLLFTIVNVISQLHTFDNFKILSPKTVKKRATGSGKATKKEMIAALPEDIKQKFKEANYKQTTGLSDLADAYWISQVE